MPSMLLETTGQSLTGIFLCLFEFKFLRLARDADTLKRSCPACQTTTQRKLKCQENIRDSSVPMAIKTQFVQAASLSKINDLKNYGVMDVRGSST